MVLDFFIFQYSPNIYPFAYGIAFLTKKYTFTQVLRLPQPLNNSPASGQLVLTVQIDGEPFTRFYFQALGFMPLRPILVRYRKELRRWPFRRRDTRALRLTFQGLSNIEHETAWSLGLQDGGALVATVNPVGARVLDARRQVPFRPNERG